VSLLQATRPKSLERQQEPLVSHSGQERKEQNQEEEGEDEEHIYAARGRRPAFYQTHTGRSNIYHPRLSTSRDPTSSRSRSTSRAPRAMEVHAQQPRAVALDPVTTRVSVSVERHAGSSSMHTRQQQQRNDGSIVTTGHSHQRKSVDFDHHVDHEEEEFLNRTRSTVPGRIVGRTHSSRHSSSSKSASHSHSHSRSRSRATEVSPSPGPLTPQDREPILGNGYPYHHHNHNTHRSSKFELGLEKHAEGT
jgi:hypothetical protein